MPEQASHLRRQVSGHSVLTSSYTLTNYFNANYGENT